MKIYKFSKVLALPFALVVMFFVIQVLRDSDYKYLAWILVPVSILMLIYLFQPQIDYWWLKRHPIEIDEKMKLLLGSINKRFREMDEAQQNEFWQSVVLFAEAKEFIAKGVEDNEVPYDIKMILSQVAIEMFGEKATEKLDQFERVVIYKHPFPTPAHPYLHTVETHAEDGVIILALEHARAGLFHPENYYNIAGHAFAQAFIAANPGLSYPEVNESDWQTIEKAFGYGKEAILSTLGLKQVDLLVVLINFYALRNKIFRKFFQEYNHKFDILLKN